MADFDPLIFKALRSSDPEERKKGVKALARTGEREALRYLATIYKEDPDPGVRQLALEGGKHVKRLQVQSDWVGHGEARDTQSTPAVASGIPQATIDESKKIMDQALDHVMNKRYEQAEALARKAFAMNPTLQHDSYYSGLAGEVMGMSVEEAVAALLEASDD